MEVKNSGDDGDLCNIVYEKKWCLLEKMPEKIRWWLPQKMPEKMVVGGEDGEVEEGVFELIFVVC